MKEGLEYLPYAIKRFGFVDGVRRWWKYHGSPMLWPKHARQSYDRWKRIDRRKKKVWSLTVYAANRDGDYYLIECPQCHRFQHLYYDQDKHRFECSPCNIEFQVYLEDGLLKILDHRDGNIPLPAKVVTDDSGRHHLGITEDAPWWWRRREIYRDYHPDTEKDAHGHKQYVVFPRASRETMGESQPDTPSPMARATPTPCP